MNESERCDITAIWKYDSVRIGIHKNLSEYVTD